MGTEHKYEKECRYCGKQLTSETTSRNFINDQNYICFGCVSKQMTPGGYKISKLERIYDPNKNKIHNEIYKKAQQHTDQVEYREELLVMPTVREKLYPSPKGRSIVVRHMEIECRDCHTILTTTNAYPEEVRTGHYICKKCISIIREDRENNPLYQERKALKSILLKLYARRRLKQFTWEYVEKRFFGIKELLVPQANKEEYDKTVKLFGEEYAAKRFRPKTTNALQESFGNLSTREGCVRLLVLFEYELYKSQHAGKRKKQVYEAKQYLKMFDPDYNHMKTDKNTGTDPDYYNTYDKYTEQAYAGATYKLKVWDPGKSEAT